MKNEEHTSKSEVSTTPSGTVSYKNSARCRMSKNLNPSDSPPVSFSKPPMMSTKLFPSLPSLARTARASISSNALLTNSSPSLATTFESGTRWKLGTELLAATTSSIASSLLSLASLPPKRDGILTSSSGLNSFFLKNKRRG